MAPRTVRQGLARAARGFAAAVACALLLPAGSSAAEPGSIAGTVTAEGGAPLQGIHVCAPPSFGARCADTDASGDYEIEGLAAGSYVVHFEGGDQYASEYYDDAASERSATPVAVDPGTTAGGIDAELAPAAHIEGVVSDAGTDAPLAGIRVCPRLPNGSGGEVGDCAVSGPDGSYSLDGLSAGSYRVSFSGSESTRQYLTQYYDGRSVAGEGLLVALAAGETKAGVDAAMAEGGTISGKATAADGGAALQGIWVCAVSPRFDVGYPVCTSTDAEGEYAILGLPTDHYKVSFSSGIANANVLDQYYDDQPTRKLATSVSVSDGATTSGVDAALRTGGRITGVVTDAVNEQPLANLFVCARPVGEPDWEAGGQMCDYTSSDGEYAIERLPTGSYYVRFGPGYASPGYLKQYYDGKGSQGEASQVAVTAGQTASGIDAAMARGGHISGEVTDALSHEAAHPIQVCAFAVGGDGEEEHCDVTDAGGAYEIDGLASGAYRVRFSPGAGFNPEPGPIDYAYATQYYEGKAGEGEADAVEVAAPATTTGIDAAMEEGGRIEGTVVSLAAGEPLEEVQACALAAGDGEYERCDSTDGSGRYTIEGLSPGEYNVAFQAFSSPDEETNFLRQYYDEADSLAGATPVSVSGGATVADVDAALRAGGQIAGTVTAAAGGAPLQGVDVCAFEAGGEEGLVLCESTDVNGDYTLSSLPTSSYKVEFAKGYPDFEGGTEAVFATQYFPGKPSAADAEPVAVTAGWLSGSIDAQMAEPDETETGGEEAGGQPGGGGSAEGGSGAPQGGPPPVAPQRPRSTGSHGPRHCPKGKRRKRVRGKVRCVVKQGRPHRRRRR
jgi:hypothetical protein